MTRSSQFAYFPWESSFHAGDVWLVGAGPGDPGLITSRGFQLLSEADVIFHDHLGCDELLSAARPDAELVNVAKFPGKQTVTQDEINEALATAAKAGKRVVRLKGGDPFVYGRGMEELEFLRERGIPCGVVPGVSSALAGPASAGIPASHRGIARTIAISTGKGGDGFVPQIPGADTRILLMAVAELPQIVAQLTDGGVGAETPAALIADATTYKQRAVIGTLATIDALARENSIEAPAVLVIGDTVRFAREEKKRKVIVVTSTRIPKLLQKLEPDAIFVWRPFFQEVGFLNEERDAARAEVRAAATEGCIIFSNRHTVKFFMELLFEEGLDARSIRARIGALGRESVKALRAAGLRPDFTVSAIDSEGVLKKLLPQVGNGNAAILGAADQGLTLVENLNQNGVSARRLTIHKFNPRDLQPVDWRFVDEVFFAGPVSVHVFHEVMPDAPIATLSACCMGETVAHFAREAGFAKVRNLAAALADAGEALNNLEQTTNATGAP